MFTWYLKIGTDLRNQNFLRTEFRFKSITYLLDFLIYVHSSNSTFKVLFPIDSYLPTKPISPKNYSVDIVGKGLQKFSETYLDMFFLEKNKQTNPLLKVRKKFQWKEYSFCD